MEKSIVLFNEKYNYRAPGFSKELNAAVESLKSVNFMFNKPPEKNILHCIDMELGAYEGRLPEICLTLSRSEQGALCLSDFITLQHIDSLRLGNFSVESLEDVMEFTNLKRISIGFTLAKKIELSPLEECKKLEEFALEMRLTKRQHDLFQNLPALKRINRVHGFDVAAVGTLPLLEYFGVHGLQRPDDMGEKLPKLKELVVFSSNALKNLDFLSQMRQLETLRIIGPMGGVEKLPDLTGADSLTSVYLRDMKNLKDLSGLKTIPSLERLRIGGNIEPSEDMLEWFKQGNFPKLFSLTLDMKLKKVAETLKQTFYGVQ